MRRSLKAGQIAMAVAPQYAGFVLIGMMGAKAAPEIYADVVKLLQKAEPTPEDKAELARKLHALAYPEGAN